MAKETKDNQVQALQPISFNQEVFMFNTLAYTQKLEKAGADRKLAEAIIQVFADVINSNLATKHDIKRDLRELELRLIIRLTVIMGSLVALGTTLLALLISFK